jgi:hypothetical protein
MGFDSSGVGQLWFGHLVFGFADCLPGLVWRKKAVGRM